MSARGGDGDGTVNPANNLQEMRGRRSAAFTTLRRRTGQPPPVHAFVPQTTDALPVELQGGVSPNPSSLSE